MNYINDRRRGENHGKVKISFPEAIKIYEELKRGVKASTLARQYGISRWTVYKIRDGRHWVSEFLRSK
jgi:Mor family transcriptional regulator